ncbi:MAG: hypothetical protein ABW056_01440 [Thermoanaerobaculia bacterium]
MIVYEGTPIPAARAGEALLAGRRVAGRLAPWGFESAGLRFDPLDRRFVFPREHPSLRPGPSRAEVWREAAARIPSGPVLVGPPATEDGGAEALWGAGSAAAQGAIDAGRPVYLLDPEPEAVPPGAGTIAVILCSWRPGRSELAFPGLARFRDSAVPRAALFPLIPGWTAEDEAIRALADTAARHGAVSLTGLVPAADGEGRRAIVDARARVEPELADRFFEVIHHADWPERLAGRVAAVREAAAGRGLLALPPRPAGRGEPRGNREAAARLEERADAPDTGEHRAALLHAAVRWIDESSRDLSAVAREGNFRKVFPFDGQVGDWAEAAFQRSPSEAEGEAGR